jgi:hypothetical protein
VCLVTSRSLRQASRETRLRADNSGARPPPGGPCIAATAAFMQETCARLSESHRAVAAQPLRDSDAAGSTSNGNLMLEQKAQVHSRLRSRPIHPRCSASWGCEMHCKALPPLHSTAQHGSAIPTTCKVASSALLMTCCSAERRLHMARAQPAGRPTHSTPRTMLADTSWQDADRSVASPRSESRNFGCPSGYQGAASRKRLAQQTRILPHREVIACSRLCGRLQPSKRRAHKWKVPVGDALRRLPLVVDAPSRAKEAMVPRARHLLI